MKTIISGEDEETLEEAVSILARGGIIAYPTETCYGLGADITNHEAVERVFIIKNRQKDRKITAAVSDIEMAKEFFSLSEEAEKLARAFMPGPLTLIVKGESFRIPANEFILKVIDKLGKPITTTSANISSLPPIYKIDEMLDLFAGEVDLIIDAGDIEERKPSTVFDLDNRKVLREGEISEKEILEVLAS